MLTCPQSIWTPNCYLTVDLIVAIRHIVYKQTHTSCILALYFLNYYLLTLSRTQKPRTSLLESLDFHTDRTKVSNIGSYRYCILICILPLIYNNTGFPAAYLAFLAPAPNSIPVPACYCVFLPKL